MTDPEYTDAIMMLHQIARMIETKMGKGLLSEDIRDCADRLQALTKETI